VELMTRRTGQNEQQARFDTAADTRQPEDVRMLSMLSTKHIGNWPLIRTSANLLDDVAFRSLPAMMASPHLRCLAHRWSAATTFYISIIIKFPQVSIGECKHGRLPRRL
jgi:hypothetical protein